MKSNSNDKYNNYWIFLCSIIIPFYITYRISTVQYIPLPMDCDEVYNYWEPLHSILYPITTTTTNNNNTDNHHGTTGTAMQTWEYHYEYALRTYSYLVPMKLLAQFYMRYFLACGYVTRSITTSTISISYKDIIINKPDVLLFLRQCLAMYTACCELLFLYGIYTVLVRKHQEQEREMQEQEQEQQQQRTEKDDTTTTTTSSSSSFSKISMIQQYSILLVLLLFCTGMNHSSSSYLPSTTWMCTWCLCTYCYIVEYHIIFVIIAIITTLTTGWPFGCICIIPMSIHIIYKEFVGTNNERHGHPSPITFLMFIIGCTIIVQSIVSLYIDSYYYGTNTKIPTLNIFLYNAQNNHDTLYGVEPISYYIKNLFLNCSLCSIFGTITIPLYILHYYYILPKLLLPKIHNHSLPVPVVSTSTTTGTSTFTIFIILCTLPAWYSITLFRPHKEERFMYPIYPVLVYGTTISIDIVINQWIVPILIRILSWLAIPSKSTSSQRLRQQYNYYCYLTMILYVVIYVPILLSFMFRTMALYKYYHAPVNVYQYLSDQIVVPIFTTHGIATSGEETPEQQLLIEQRQLQLNFLEPRHDHHIICMCGEWYRYSSSFYLPNQSYNNGTRTITTQIGFLPSSFKGQLPQPFTIYGSKYESIQYLQPFNDQNIEQKERYITDVTQCTHVIDVSDSTDCRTQFDPTTTTITPIYAVPLLDTDRTTSTLHRIYYIPYYHEYILQQQQQQNGIEEQQQIVYKNYTLYKIEHYEDFHHAASIN